MRAARCTLAGTWVALAACGGTSRHAANDTATARNPVPPADTLGQHRRALDGGAAGPGDSAILAALDAANAADSSVGAVAFTKGTSLEVRAFARQMTRDHHALREQGRQLARRLGIALRRPSDEDGADGHDATPTWHVLAVLDSAPRGAPFDKSYVDHEVIYHQALLGTARAALATARRAELRDFIQRAIPNLQAHLDRARSVRRSLR